MDSIVFLTAILAALIAAWVALYSRRKNVTEANVKEFITVFVGFIQVLETQGALFTSSKMKEIVTQHRSAEIKLRNSLNWWGQKKFNCYWNQYRKKADRYYNAPAQLGFSRANKEMLETVKKLIKKVKGL